MKHLVVLTTLAVVSLASACSKQSEPTAASPVAQVTTARAVRADLPVLVTGFGEVEFDPAAQTTIAAKNEAIVTAVAVRVGQDVAAGDELVRLAQSPQADLALRTARADAAGAEAAAARAVRLRADGLASDADVETARTAAADAAALLASLRSRSSDVLTAPGEGIVDAIAVEPGDTVSPGSLVVRLASADAIRARINIEVEDVDTVSIGDKVALSGFEPGAPDLPATVVTVDHRADPATRRASVFADIPQDTPLLPGEGIKGAITTDTKTGAVTVPRQAILYDETGAFLFAEVGGKASLKRVEVGILSGDTAEITQGVSAGDVIIVEGAAVLSDGMDVTETPIAASAGPGDQPPAPAPASAPAQATAADPAPAP